MGEEQPIELSIKGRGKKPYTSLSYPHSGIQDSLSSPPAGHTRLSLASNFEASIMNPELRSRTYAGDSFCLLARIGGEAYAIPFHVTEGFFVKEVVDASKREEIDKLSRLELQIRAALGATSNCNGFLQASDEIVELFYDLACRVRSDNAYVCKAIPLGDALPTQNAPHRVPVQAYNVTSDNPVNIGPYAMIYRHAAGPSRKDYFVQYKPQSPELGLWMAGAFPNLPAIYQLKRAGTDVGGEMKPDDILLCHITGAYNLAVRPVAEVVQNTVQEPAQKTVPSRFKTPPEMEVPKHNPRTVTRARERRTYIGLYLERHGSGNGNGKKKARHRRPKTPSKQVS